ncbi:hypothetical protein D9757_003891 [Collybiopsis confluens]|uniref:LAGLIDADG homing endonuclease n=1 Tax=Collybiopsis confluens TaxID=2823264 RepID=A0A8H5HV45_9AGAR|nr:hypothetical protein D9757_003891 [Collybiopsis confluens]
MLTLAPIYVLWIFWTAVNVTASPILEQRLRTSWDLYLGKKDVGTPHERWGIFFTKLGDACFAANVTKEAIRDEEPKMERLSRGSGRYWKLIDLNAKISYEPGSFMSSREGLYDWIEHKMVSSLRQSTPRPDWWPQGTPFDSSPQPMRVIYYGGPEPDVNNPQAPNKRKRTGGSSLDMVWVILEELGNRKMYLGDNQGVPEIFQREFNENYIKIWRRRWQTTAHGEKAVEWMLKQYPQSRFPKWAKLWTEEL